MNSSILTSEDMYKGLMIKEDVHGPNESLVVKKWYVKGRNLLQSNGWNIICGSTLRLIFPIDLEDYYL